MIAAIEQTEAESSIVSTPAPVEKSVLPAALIEQVLRNPKKVRPLPPEYIDTETLWLARCMFSETKRPEEQELVGWVVRNRVETTYRGKRTYEDVVLDDYQFSAFNPESRKRRYYSNLHINSRTSGWQNTLYLAYYVRHADVSLRPFSHKTRHFYSERSMVGKDRPEWVSDEDPVTPARPLKLDPARFRFYDGVN